MKVTTTKKLRGSLQISSLGIQMIYDHQKDKPQVRALEDRHYSNCDLQAAADLKLITISDVGPNTDEEEDDLVDTGPELTVRLINRTNSPILLSAAKVTDTREIAAKGSLVLPVSILNNPAIAAIIASGKVDVEDLETKDVVSEKDEPAASGPLDLDDLDDVDEEAPADDTTAVVANPNDETMHNTEQSIKKVNASKTKPVEKEKDSRMRVYSPSELNKTSKEGDDDGDDEEEDTPDFVDKEQEKQRIKDLSVTKTETVQIKKMGETTPTIVQRKAQPKASKKKVAKKTTKKAEVKPASGEKTILEI